MATFYSAETTGVLDGTSNFTRGDARKLGGRVHAIVGTITLASQAAGSVIVFGEIPNGAVPLAFSEETDTTLATATLAVGSLASASKYAAAHTLTTTDTPTSKMKTSAVGVPTTAVETLALTIAAAALPAAGTLVVKFEYTMPEGG